LVNERLKPFILDDGLQFTSGGSQIYDFPGLVDSSRQAHPFWDHLRRQEDAADNLLFVHFGLYFDHFSAEKRKVRVLNLRLLTIDSTAAERLPCYYPLAMFETLASTSTEVYGDELAIVLSRLQPLFEKLARGIIFKRSGPVFYRVVGTVSMLFADIPAIYQLIGLKVSSTSLHPCIWCGLRYFSGELGGHRCRLRCDLSLRT
jgi:hypothetical protein